MTEPPSDRCGYTWPKNYDPNFIITPDLEIGVGHESCCYRNSLPDTNRCAWHADPSTTEYKNIEHLRKSRSPPEIRELNSPFNELLDGANLANMNLTDRFIHSKSLKNCALRDGVFSNSELESIGLEDAHLWRADLTNVSLWGAQLSGANLHSADLSNSFLGAATLTSANLKSANLSSARLSGILMGDANLSYADISGAELNGAQLVGADLTKADLTDTSLQNTSLINASLERASLTRADLFDAHLQGSKMEGALFSDARLNEETFRNLGGKSRPRTGGNNYNRLKRLVLGPEGPDQYRCAYDPKLSTQSTLTSENKDAESRAGGVYLELERLAASNALSNWQSRFFLLRQDMETRRLKREKRYLDYMFQTVQKSLFGYGEKFGRVIGWSILIILVFALIYVQGGWIRPVGSGGTFGPAISWTRLPEEPGVIWDSIYYSTLTFTALGFGDFRPTTSLGQLFTIVETSLGAIMLALLVYVLGRRSSR